MFKRRKIAKIDKQIQSLENPPPRKSQRLPTAGQMERDIDSYLEKDKLITELKQEKARIQNSNIFGK